MQPTAPHESPVAVVASWATLTASFVLSFATWWALGSVAGYDVVTDSHTIYLSWALAICVDGYIVTALVTWLSPVSDRVARFARWNMYGAAAVGVAAQSSYHGGSVWSATHSGWQTTLATVVGALPPLFAALSVHLRGMVLHDTRAVGQVAAHPTPEPAVDTTPAPHPTPVTPPTPRPVIPPRVVPTPAPARRTRSPHQLPPALLTQARALRDHRAAKGLTTGRRVLVAELDGVTDGVARQIIADLATEPHLRPVASTR